jgi:hypothetical protein
MTWRANWRVWPQAGNRVWLEENLLISHRWNLRFARRHRDHLYAGRFVLGTASGFVKALAKALTVGLAEEWRRASSSPISAVSGSRRIRSERRRVVSTQLNRSSPDVEDQTPDRMVSTALSIAEKTAAVTKVQYLERELFDDSGHVQRGLTTVQADQIVTLINDLRHALGWLEIDLDGKWRWPPSAQVESTSRRRVA